LHLWLDVRHRRRRMCGRPAQGGVGALSDTKIF